MRRIRDQHQVREILFQRGPGESGEVDVAEEVAVHREEGPIAEQGKRLCDSPRGFERLGFARIAERASSSINQTIRGLPRTSRSTLGTASVRGLMRSPRPAARIMAFIGRNQKV